MIGINQRIPINILELALRAALMNEGSSEYFASLARTEYKGENRINKAVSVINKLTIKNQLWPYMEDNAGILLHAITNKNDRPLICAAIISSAYSFCFDILVIAGKCLHSQDEVSTTLIINKLAEKYGSNRSLFNAFHSILPMLIEAGFIQRPKVGIIKAIPQINFSDFALDFYKQSFLINQDIYSVDDDYMSNSYFEFIKK